MRASSLLIVAFAAWFGAVLGVSLSLSPLFCLAALLLRRRLSFVAVSTFLLAAGWAGQRMRSLPEPVEGIVELEGWVISPKLLETERGIFELETELPPGTHLAVTAKAVKKHPKQWALGFDALDVGLRHGIVARLATNEALIRLLPGARLADYPRRVRFELAQRLGATPAAGVARAIVLGDRARLVPEDEKAMVRAGIVHVLSVSGLHVSATALVLLWVLQSAFGLLMPFAAFSARRAAALSAIPLLAVYVVLTGAEVPALRSAIAAGFVLAHFAGGPRSEPSRMLALGLLALVFVAPEQCIDPGFAFSFSGMAVLVVWLPRHLEGRSRIARVLIAAALPSLAAAPLSAFYFAEIPTAGALLNIVAIPFASLMVIVGLVWLALPIVQPVLLWQAEALRIVSHAVPLDTVIAAKLWPWELALAGVAIVLFCARLRSRHAFLAFLCAYLAPFCVRFFSEDAVVSTLPVGQGDAHVIFLPRGRTLVIDGGPDEEARVLRPFLLAWRVRSIDGVILTHRHPDHSAGLTHLGATFAVGDATAPLTLLHPLGEPRFEELSENDNSRVFLLRHAGRSVLFTGDAETLAEDFFVPKLNHVDVIKIGHHGSHTSTSAELLRKATPRFALISCGIDNGFGHPHAQTLQRLHGVEVYRTDQHGLITTRLSAHGDVTVHGFRLD